MLKWQVLVLTLTKRKRTATPRLKKWKRRETNLRWCVPEGTRPCRRTSCGTCRSPPRPGSESFDSWSRDRTRGWRSRSAAPKRGALKRLPDKDTRVKIIFLLVILKIWIEWLYLLPLWVSAWWEGFILKFCDSVNFSDIYHISRRTEFYFSNDFFCIY